MSANHTPGPWHVDGGYRLEIRCGAISIADIRWNGHNDAHGEANARRIVACVNALEGHSTATLEMAIQHSFIAAADALVERDQLRERVAELEKLVAEHINAFGLQALRDRDELKMSNGWLKFQEQANAVLAKVRP